jgi:hypothetical protein
MKRVLSGIVLVLLAALSTAALGKGVKNSPAVALRKDAVVGPQVKWARTIESHGAEHAVVWRAKTGELHMTLVSNGVVGLSKELTSPHGKVVGVSNSAKSVVIAAPNQTPSRFVRLWLTGKRAGKTTVLNSHDVINTEAGRIFRERVKTGAPGTQDGDWQEAERRLNPP